MASTFPGFDSPMADFEEPYAMLDACHERVRRSLALLDRLVEHIDESGHNNASRAAATDVLRYFELAAPQHHEDEERHVFALLAEQGDPALRAAVQVLRRDHERMAVLWHELRISVSRWSRAQSSGAVDDATRRLAAEFTALYAQHLEREEAFVFPAAKLRSDGKRLADMGAEMQQRRQVASQRPQGAAKSLASP